MNTPLRLDYAVNDADVIAAFKRQQSEMEKERKARQDLEKTINSNAAAQKSADKAASESAKEAAAVAAKYRTEEQKTAAEIAKVNKLHEEGALSSEDHAQAIAQLTRDLKAEEKAAKDATAAEKAQAATLKEAAAVVAKFSTEQQKNAAELRRVKELYEAGALSVEQYDQAVVELSRDLQAEEKAAKDAAAAERAQSAVLKEAAAVVQKFMTEQQKNGAELKRVKELYEAGALSIDQYDQAVAELARDVRAEAEAERRNNDQMKQAAAIIERLKTPQEKYQENLKKLKTLHESGKLSAEQYAAAQKQEGDALADSAKSSDAFGGSLGGLTTKIATTAAGFVSMQAVIGFLKEEYDALIERQGKSRDANISLAAEQEDLITNLGDAGAKDVFASVRTVSQESGVKEEVVTRAVNEAMAAKADMSVDDVLAGVKTAAKVRKFAPSELAGLAGATIDTQKQTGLGTDESLGFLMQMQSQSRAVSLKGVAENFTPAVGGIMNLGADRQTAGALLASLSHGMGDTTGAQSATSGIQLAKQLREFGQQFAPDTANQRAEMEASQSAEKLALKAEFDKKSIALRADKSIDPATKAEKQRVLTEEKTIKTEELKQTHVKQSQEFEASAETMSVDQVLTMLQKDEKLRQQFLAGKDQGGFGATFEAKALPAIESLLSGTKQAEQYAAAKVELSKDPLATLNKAIENRGESAAIKLAEQDQVLANLTDQQKLGDVEGATSAVNRDRLKEFRQQSGRWGISSRLQGFGEDVLSGGKQTSEGTISAMESEVAALKAGKTDAVNIATGESLLGKIGAVASGGMTTGIGAVVARKIAEKNAADPEYQKQVKVLEELVAVAKQQLASQQQGQVAVVDVAKQQLAAQQQVRHAGLVAGRANNQGESGP